MYINTSIKNSSNNQSKLPTNENNKNNTVTGEQNDITISPTRAFPANDPIFTQSSSLKFIKTPKRVNEFKNTDLDEIIKINTAKNRYIPVRSKSLPFNSTKLKSNLKKNLIDSRPNHQRSKSVHFDETVPFKYYQKNDCPTIVSRYNRDPDLITKINYDIKKPLSRMDWGNSSENDDDDEDSDEEFMHGPFSSRLQNDGFYDTNFPLLNSPSNTDLKLNIFANSHSNPHVILQNIKLEKRITYNNLNDYFVWGKILVKNIFFDKLIYVRYTLNGWKTYNEVKAKYINVPSTLPITFSMNNTESFDNYDTFEFGIHSLKNLILNENEHEISKDNIIEGHLEFCIHYETFNSNEKLEFWENNSDKNYSMRLILHEKDNEDNSNKEKNSDGFYSDKYYNLANELGGFNRHTNKFGGGNAGRRTHRKQQEGKAQKNLRNPFNKNKKISTTFLEDILTDNELDDEFDLDLQLKDNYELPMSSDGNKENNNAENEDKFWFNNNLFLTTSKLESLEYNNNKSNDQAIFFKDFRNPFAN